MSIPPAAPTMFICLLYRITIVVVIVAVGTSSQCAFLLVIIHYNKNIPYMYAH